MTPIEKLLAEAEKWQPVEAGKLLPCPFCGSKPIYGGSPDLQIKCPQCWQSSVKASWYDNDIGTTEAAWNTRAENDIVARLAEALNAAVEGLLAIENWPCDAVIYVEGALTRINAVAEANPDSQPLSNRRNA